MQPINTQLRVVLLLQYKVALLKTAQKVIEYNGKDIKYGG